MTIQESLASRLRDTPKAMIDGEVNGFRIINSGFSATAGEVFHKLEVVVAADITAANSFGGDDPDGSVTYPVGFELRGCFAASSVSVTTGTVIGYLA